MIAERQSAFFLWLGSDLPDLARISVLSAAEAGFQTVLFIDRPQTITHPHLRLADWREIELPWTPDDVRLKGEVRPCYAAFSDLFRFALLSRHDGWWFDCDTIILRPASDFSRLLQHGTVTVGKEDARVINGAVLGSNGGTVARDLYDEAARAFPVLDGWGVVGPALITRMIAEGHIAAHVLDQDAFYPIHHNDIAQIYLPDHCEALLAQEPKWYCLSLWGEVLSRSGLKYLAPPPGSYLADLLKRHAALGPVRGNDAEMAAYLAQNLHRLDDMNSGRHALSTLSRKVQARLFPKGMR